MRQRGFSLVELIIAMAIMGTLLSIATLNWNEMQTKCAIESQIKTMHADLMEVRLNALYTKTARSVVISGTDYKAYATTDITATPLETKQLRYPVVKNTGGALTFNTQGLTNGTECSICILPTNDNSAAVDSMVISQCRINLGKRKTGGACDGDHIDQK
jgi:prepilin-type N-terminal cleavage/methylation domain-containing protein